MERKTAVVVGGGLAGIAAATVLAERGVHVTVVESQPVLGGRVSAWTDHLSTGESFEMERGFHAFFRHYYNVRALIRRIDPSLRCLTPLSDYPILGPTGEMESFANLPKRTPLNLLSLVSRTKTLRLRDLPNVRVRALWDMLAFDMKRTYQRYDSIDARSYLDSLQFPEKARRMLFDVFAHSFFNPEDAMSAGELLMMFHFYFLGNPEGLVFDVLREPFSVALWNPLRAYLERLDVRFRMNETVRRVSPQGSRWTASVANSDERLSSDFLVLAVTVPALKSIVSASDELRDSEWRTRIQKLSLTEPFAVWRLWLDRRMRAERHAFAGTAGCGILDNISLFHLFEGESGRWAKDTDGSVVELHAYAVPKGYEESRIKAELWQGLQMLYPETRDARVLEERFLLRQDCPAFPPKSYVDRPHVETPFSGLCLAGDCIYTPTPTALMERAVTTGFMAANHLLSDARVPPEPIQSVPPRGLFGKLY